MVAERSVRNVIIKVEIDLTSGGVDIEAALRALRLLRELLALRMVYIL